MSLRPSFPSSVNEVAAPVMAGGVVVLAVGFARVGLAFSAVAATLLLPLDAPTAGWAARGALVAAATPGP